MSKEILIKIGNIKIPFFLPKRSKGHIEVVGIGEVSTSKDINGYDFVKSIIAQARVVWDREMMVRLTKQLIKEMKVPDLELKVEFQYTVERSTPTYELTFFELPCFLRTIYRSGKVKFIFGICIPIRINNEESSIITSGKLHFQIEEPIIKSFEDLLDFVQKNADVKIYPINSQKDSLEIGKVIDIGMSPRDYIDLLTTSVSKSKILGKKCTISIESSDVYNMFKLERTYKW